MQRRHQKRFGLHGLGDGRRPLLYHPSVSLSASFREQPLAVMKSGTPLTTGGGASPFSWKLRTNHKARKDSGYSRIDFCCVLLQRLSEVLDHPHVNIAGSLSKGEVTSVWRRDGIPKWSISLAL